MGVTAPQRWRLPCLPAVTDTRAPTPLHVVYFRVFRGLWAWVWFCFCLPRWDVPCAPSEAPASHGTTGPRREEERVSVPEEREQAGVQETREASRLTQAHARLRVVPSSSRPPRARGAGRGGAASRRGASLPARAPPRSRPQPLPPRLPFLYLKVDSVHFCTGTIDDFICLKCLIYMHIYLSVRIMF